MWKCILTALILCSSAAGQGDLVDDVRQALSLNSSSSAEAELRNYKSQNGVTPEYLEALSWIARGAAAHEQWTQAATYATQARTLVEQRLAGGKQKLDSDPHLPIALGAAYEVLAQQLDAEGKHAQAVSVLRTAIARYQTTSIGARLQKNLNLLVLVGQPAPPLQVAQFLGPKPPALATLKGSPVLLFFWAHWCGDCKAEVPIIVRLRQEFGPQGLFIMGPTQLYGYAAQGADANPAQEQAYIEAVRSRYYASLSDMPVPLSNKNFAAYGASTTPTLVVLNREGRVSMYHPGAMPYDELRAAVAKAVAR